MLPYHDHTPLSLQAAPRAQDHLHAVFALQANICLERETHINVLGLLRSIFVAQVTSATQRVRHRAHHVFQVIGCGLILPFLSISDLFLKGTYNAILGQSSCTACSAGSANPYPSQTSAGACVLCENGKVTSSVGMFCEPKMCWYCMRCSDHFILIIKVAHCASHVSLASSQTFLVGAPNARTLHRRPHRRLRLLRRAFRGRT